MDLYSLKKAAFQIGYESEEEFMLEKPRRFYFKLIAHYDEELKKDKRNAKLIQAQYATTMGDNEVPRMAELLGFAHTPYDPQWIDPEELEA